LWNDVNVLMNRLIQIVEDDADIRFIVEYILEDANYTVETFEGAKAFLNELKGSMSI
jgi:FixJ family two-component response regulator